MFYRFLNSSFATPSPWSLKFVRLGENDLREDEMKEVASDVGLDFDDLPNASLEIDFQVSKLVSSLSNFLIAMGKGAQERIVTRNL